MNTLFNTFGLLIAALCMIKGGNSTYNIPKIRRYSFTYWMYLVNSLMHYMLAYTIAEVAFRRMGYLYSNYIGLHIIGFMFGSYILGYKRLNQFNSRRDKDVRSK